MKEEIGFKHGIPEDPNRSWEKQIKGRVFSFRKLHQRKGLFIYNCQCNDEHGDSSTGFHSERDLTPAEVEALPQFAPFIDGCTRA